MSPFFSRCIFIVCCLLCFEVSAQPGEILHRSYADKYKYLDSFDAGRTARNKLSLAELEQWARQNDDPELACMLRYKSCREAIYGVSSAIAPELLDSLRKDAADFPLVTIDVIQLTGDYYLDILHKNSWALEYYIEAYNAYAGLSADKFPARRRYLYALAGCYYRYGDIDNAIGFFKKALDAKPAFPDELVNTINNTLGICYQKQKKYDSSEIYLRATYSNAIKQGDSVWMLIAGQNLGITYFYENKHEDAIPLLGKDIFDPRHLVSIPVNMAVAAEVLAEIYYGQGNMNEAGKYLGYVLFIFRKEKIGGQSALLEKTYRLLHTINVKKNELPTANRYADSAMEAAEAAHKEEMALNQTSAEERAQFATHKGELQRLRYEQRIDIMFRNSLVVTIILVALICLLLVNRQRLAKNKLLAEHRIAETELGSFKNSVHEKNLLIENFTTELDKIKRGNEEKADNELITRLEQSIILTDEQWDNFKLLFEKVHKGFFVSLKKKMPDLTQAEVRLMALTKLKLTTKEMAAMLGISVSTIRSYRHRLRKKLDVESDELIEGLLDEV